MTRQGSLPVLDVTSWAVREPEGAGGDEKLWLASSTDELWLFKPRTDHATWSQGEDWAEAVVAELARSLGVPAARVELAVRAGRRGSVSLSLRPPGWEMQHGALLLADLLPDFATRSKERTGHTLDNIETVLRDVAAPAGGDRLPLSRSSPATSCWTRWRRTRTGTRRTGPCCGRSRARAG